MKTFWGRAAAVGCWPSRWEARPEPWPDQSNCRRSPCRWSARRTTTLRVRNTEAQPITLQLRAVDWTQANGEDVSTPSQTLAVSPPVFTLKPGETQTVRVVVENVSTIKAEKAYRLILDQMRRAASRATPASSSRSACCCRCS